MFRPSRMSSAALKRCQQINAELTEEIASLQAEIEELKRNNLTTTLQQLQQTNNILSRNLNPLSNENLAELNAFQADINAGRGGYQRVLRKYRTNKHRSKKRKGTKRR